MHFLFRTAIAVPTSRIAGLGFLPKQVASPIPRSNLAKGEELISQCYLSIVSDTSIIVVKLVKMSTPVVDWIVLVPDHENALPKRMKARP